MPEIPCTVESKREIGVEFAMQYSLAEDLVKRSIPRNTEQDSIFFALGNYTRFRRVTRFEITRDISS